MNPVGIIGAGPAGLTTAIKLREEGFESIVLEEHNTIGIPEHCSGLVSVSGLKDLKVNPENSLQNEIYGAKIFSPNGTMIKIEKHKPVAYVINRKEFDQDLLKTARGKGIHVATGTKLIDVRNNTLFVQTDGGRGEMRKAEYIVGADGVNSTLRHLVGIKTGKENFIHTVQSTCTGEFNTDFVELHLGNYAKGFFAWCIPISKTKARIGLGSLLGDNVVNNYKTFLNEKFSNVRVGVAKSSLIPYGLPLQGIVKDNIALVGDAAFQTKATTGGGIVFGMKAGNILAQNLATVFKKKGNLSDYEKKMSGINKELKMHWKIRNYFNSLSNEQIDKLFKKLKDKDIEYFLEREGDMDNPSSFVGKMAKSPKYWFMAKTLLGIARS
ncbi:MAG: NAD(P)/FAD-dependent oxidoreductase [Candidatus Diapherotrites archaeon]|uniref:NAD(P)/FAD-dependent oxidoreductase n=1 Tax=Candidatus Iainarchaeum sp. TaxID=3101447 RepID=A0A8T5GE45_9ARCH|nr:NAD(P)/FAD-dependent oxidoreductase [Candidatus Diapherotrites archaeon]